MQIDRMYFPTTTLGYGKRVSIWTVGCHRHCPSCSNPELQAPCPDKDIAVEELLKPIAQMLPEIDGVTITGGEPFDQPDELALLLCGLKDLGIADILVYTGYTLAELQMLGTAVQHMLSQIGVLIDGTYIENFNDGRSIRGSSNQTIHILNNCLRKRYEDVLNWTRKSEVVNCNGLLLSIGIPPKPSMIDRQL